VIAIISLEYISANINQFQEEAVTSMEDIKVGINQERHLEFACFENTYHSLAFL
jgi:hypothetical protein